MCENQNLTPERILLRIEHLQTRQTNLTAYLKEVGITGEYKQLLAEAHLIETKNEIKELQTMFAKINLSELVTIVDVGLNNRPLSELGRGIIFSSDNLINN